MKQNKIKIIYSSSSLLKGDYRGFLKKWMKNISAFTLVEVLISMAIFSIMSVSIIWIYIISSDITMKSDINRMMQENIKNVVEKIAEDVRKNWIDLEYNPLDSEDCNYNFTNYYNKSNKLCTKSWNRYLLAHEDSFNPWTFIRVTNVANQCSWIDKHCIIMNKVFEPLTNSFVSIKNLTFHVSKDPIPKVTVNIVMQPSIKKWIKVDLIKESKLIFQTTISERPF